MVTSNLMGGLGNYLFQIASVYSLALDNNDEAVFNINDIVTGHQPIKSYTNNILSKINFVDYSLSLENDCYKPFFHSNGQEFHKIRNMNREQLTNHIKTWSWL
jgi:hypothetical protein